MLMSKPPPLPYYSCFYVFCFEIFLWFTLVLNCNLDFFFGLLYWEINAITPLRVHASIQLCKFVLVSSFGSLLKCYLLVWGQVGEQRLWLIYNCWGSIYKFMLYPVEICIIFCNLKTVSDWFPNHRKSSGKV